MKNMSIFYLIIDKEFMDIRKFKDAYLVMLCVKLIENLLTRMKLKTLQTLWKLDYLKFFFPWNYLDINYVFQSTCNLWALCGFNTMPCVISRWSSNLVYVVFVAMDQIQVNALSLWMMRSSLLPMGGRDFLIVCGWGCYPWGQETTCKRGPI